ncbi:bifunctional [glutamate--ammonia ligase]-adenylyl-L-tyrosine phosphorylase/[glutamate--ammonia-ligase] adenylyltransferase [Thalassolituus alkanivorans]|uniref:bifunctional [glutamate--ammonia ligase]-adenylyl-L-tyrosine phosphorylase/[glutamate--ammonia-ligase] adenylyltransferase n=1 Tax=Thalassolituus alkanivorans TaxID=2881055 RepID=UPI001E45CC46|nr:bifunctional [glutamate--ammonia ligase]-adenylyl-L-tyrosine phosphorylase/[glutamate--ammonia-ligase] adenylyltransferase [Thalassolituus alkanivorans]MCB2386103.1 bifunctional [glutamate--ammonia ligase]-adenylyl-L-tyrosine phosphorylase/[glutamate--ammonia-ligase] adenylyltransferase [Thalassolituus alkanivorans]MCB2423092.1 bifunctional [glutamate--ammonia ligase]-adenylyl-L-tyrosine phosphorylase/[glutamate--ammonia-ligase] adenylyltransferase [Thalassolituus alkanivorans]
MLSAALHDHWQQVTTGLTDHGERTGFDWPALWQSLSTEQQARAQKVLSISDYVADALPREPHWFTAALAEDRLSQPLPRATISQWLDELSAGAESDEDWHKAVRVLRRRAMVQIIWRDLLRLAPTLETTRALSDLADECVVRSLEFLSRSLFERHGHPIGKASGNEQQMLVLGMGKLGAYELNLSSDIDLIFTYPESGETSGPKVITNQEFFVKLGQKLIQALDKHTADGFVFRTDMRLRPYGQSGPLVMNFASVEEYYQDQGRDWERYAMVKARIMNGEQSAEAKELLSILRPFTYRVYVDYSAFASLRSMKAMINAEVRRRGLEMNVKLGAGGIREVEFIVQAFQLIRGGQDKSLQTRELVKVLGILQAEGYLPAAACDELKQAYLFLRDSEHALQALNDEQTQLLPEDDSLRARVALALGFSDWDSYLNELEQHRSKVRHHFAQIVASDDDNEETDELQQVWSDLWLGELDEQQAAAFLEQHPCANSTEVQQQLSNFRDSRTVLKMQQIGRERLDALMPLLLQQLWQQPEPVTTLERIVPLLEAVVRRTAYLVLLKENPQALTQLVKLCGASSWVAEYITQTPLLLDELLSPANLYRLPERKELAEELHLRLLRVDPEDLEQQMEQLRQFVRAHKLRAAACEVMDALPLMKISDYLTWLAEVTLQTVMELSWSQMVAKYGYPTNTAGEAVSQPEFAVIGYGKVGGLELSYSSDLDLVLLHNSASGRYTDGERSQDNGVFYTRMGQRMIHILTTQTRSGDLYEVDMRLRPSGNSGMIVASMKAFEEYQQKHAWTWEHQALVRARVLCGSQQAADEFQAIRNATLSQPRDLGSLREEVRAMRQKMVDNLGSKDTSGQQFHLKQDAGGIVDIEFLVQYGVLAWSHQYPELLDVTDNMRLLDAFDTAGLMDPQDCQTLQETYLSYRAETHRRALQKQKLLLDSDTLSKLGFNARRNDVTRLWKLWLETDTAS